MQPNYHYSENIFEHDHFCNQHKSSFVTHEKIDMVTYEKKNYFGIDFGHFFFIWFLTVKFQSHLEA